MAMMLHVGLVVGLVASISSCIPGVADLTTNIPDPILVVCGLHNTKVASSCSDEVAPLVTRFNQNGYAELVNLTGKNDNEQSIIQIRAAVDRVLALPRFYDASPRVTKVNLIGYSMGGLSTRAFVADAADSGQVAADGVRYVDKVRRVIGIGTGEQGDSGACILIGPLFIAFQPVDNVPAYQQLCPGSAFLKRINGNQQNSAGSSNGRDDTRVGTMPWCADSTGACRDDAGARIEYYSIWATGDVNSSSPGGSAQKLDGGACLDYISSPSMTHLNEPGNSTVQSHVNAALHSECQGTPTYTAW